MEGLLARASAQQETYGDGEKDTNVQARVLVRVYFEHFMHLYL
jgi:hypothetical protein